MTQNARCRLVVLVSGSGSNLQALIDAARDPAYPCEVAAVLSNKAGVLGLERAVLAGIPTRVVAHTAFADRTAFDQALAEAVASFRPDLVVLAGFMRILSAAFVGRFAGRLLNIHPSLLPKYPGLHTHQRAIEAGDTEAGATVHFVTDELDGGPLIAQARVPVLAGDTAASLAARVLVEEHRLYPYAARLFAEGRIRLVDGRILYQGHRLKHPLALSD